MIFDSILNVFGFETTEWTQQAIRNSHLGIWKIMMDTFSILIFSGILLMGDSK